MIEPNQPYAKSIRWHSTVESAENLEFSVLAAVESVCAVLLSLWVAWYFQTYTHLVVAIGLAPLLLLRTEESTRLGLKWFGELLDNPELEDYLFTGLAFIGIILWFMVTFDILTFFLLSITLFIVEKYKLFSFENKYTIKGVIQVALLMVTGWALAVVTDKFGVEVVVLGVGILMGLGVVGAVGAISPVIKFTATTFTFFRHPLSSLQAIPENWYRIVLATDMMHPPEFLPGIESQQYCELIKNFEKLRFHKWLKNPIINESNIFSKILGWILTLIFFFPAFLYRWSLKSSALFYLPFIWIIGTPTHIKKLHENLDEQLALWKDSALAKVGVIYAVIVIVFFTALPLFLKIKLHDLSAGLPPNWHELTEIIVPFFVTFEWKAWHVARFLAAVITLGVWFYLDTLVIQRKFRKEAGSHGEAKIIFHLLRFRQLLSLFTLACGVYVLYQIIPWAEIFRNFQWLPWC